MKKFLIAIALALISIPAVAASLDHYPGGFRTIDGNQLNKMVDAVNNITGNGTAAAITGTTGTFSGVVSIGNGTVSLPSLTFGSDLDSGIYRIGANNIGVAVNATKILDIATTGVTVTGAVTATTNLILGSTTFTEATLALYSKGVAAGYKIARGETALDGTNPTPVSTGLASITGCSLTIKATAAPGLSTSVVTYDTSTGTMNMYGWKPTGAGDTTLIASAGTDTVGWICVGT